MTEAHRIDADIAIVGSGAGGGTVAAALAPLCRSGLRVALFEWGGRVRARDNNRHEMEMVARHYVDGGAVRTSTGEMTLAAGRGVGGSTNVYTGVTFEPPDRVLDKWNLPGIDRRDLQPRLNRLSQATNAHYHDPEEINENNRLFAAGCRRLGWPVAQFPVNTRGCTGLNTCNLGCAVLAMQGTAQVQIPAAEADGVSVYPFCRIDRIAGDRLVGHALPPTPGRAPGTLSPGPLEVRARQVVLAGGTLNSAPLLMRSFPDWARRWPALGRYFTCHPALILVGQHAQPVDGAIGPPKSYYCDRFAESKRFLLESCFYPPFATARNLIGYGNDLQALMARMDRQQQLLALTLDSARPENRVRVDRAGRPVVDYAIDADTRTLLAAAIRAGGRLLFAAGARRAHLPGTDAFFTYRKDADRLGDRVRPERLQLGGVTLSAAHLMGGCRMGTDTATSVTDPWGRVHGRDGLYVADASLFPDSVEVNPYLTVMALADRVAEAVRGDIGGARA